LKTNENGKQEVHTWTEKNWLVSASVMLHNAVNNYISHPLINSTVRV